MRAANPNQLLVSLPVKNDEIGDLLHGLHVLEIIAEEFKGRFEKIACLIFYVESEPMNEMVHKAMSDIQAKCCNFEWYKQRYVDYNFFMSDGNLPRNLIQDVKDSEVLLKGWHFTHIVEVSWRRLKSWLFEGDKPIIPDYLAQKLVMIHLAEMGGPVNKDEMRSGILSTEAEETFRTLDYYQYSFGPLAHEIGLFYPRYPDLIRQATPSKPKNKVAVFLGSKYFYSKAIFCLLPSTIGNDLTVVVFGFCIADLWPREQERFIRNDTYNNAKKTA